MLTLSSALRVMKFLDQYDTFEFNATDYEISLPVSLHGDCCHGGIEAKAYYHDLLQDNDLGKYFTKHFYDYSKILVIDLETIQGLDRKEASNLIELLQALHESTTHYAYIGWIDTNQFREDDLYAAVDNEESGVNRLIEQKLNNGKYLYDIYDFMPNIGTKFMVYCWNQMSHDYDYGYDLEYEGTDLYFNVHSQNILSDYIVNSFISRLTKECKKCFCVMPKKDKNSLCGECHLLANTKVLADQQFIEGDRTLPTKEFTLQELLDLGHDDIVDKMKVYTYLEYHTNTMTTKITKLV